MGRKHGFCLTDRCDVLPQTCMFVSPCQIYSISNSYGDLDLVYVKMLWPELDGSVLTAYHFCSDI